MKKVCLLLFLLPLMGFSPDKPVKIKINENITVSLPGELKPMTPEDVAQRYPSVRAPLGAFTTEDRLVTFSVNISATQWPDQNLELAQKFFKSGIYNLYDHIDMVKEGIHEIHKKKFIFFEFESRIGAGRSAPGPSIKTYTFIQYLVQNDRSLVFSFSCPVENRQEWEERAAEIMKSIHMK